MADLVSECNSSTVSLYINVCTVTCIRTCNCTRMADLVSECNVVSAVHSYVPVPVTYLSEVRMTDLVSECNVVSAVHSYVPVPVPVTYCQNG